MKAVFSFWNTTGTILENATNWTNPKFHLYSWVLSVHQAAKHFQEVELVTDSISLEVFEKLKLPFTRIRTDLDEIEQYPKSFWSLGKVKAYQIQNRPFIHIDNDFIMYRKPSDNFLSSPIGFQCRETDDWFEDYYRGQFNHLNDKGVHLPSSWGLCDEAYNFGIYSCNDMSYNEEYCKEAFELVDSNAQLMLDTGHAGLYSVLFEQYMGAAVSYRLKTSAAFLSEYCNYEEIEQQGLIHIWGEKNNINWFKNIEKIVYNQYANHYNIINAMFNSYS